MPEACPIEAKVQLSYTGAFQENPMDPALEALRTRAESAERLCGILTTTLLSLKDYIDRECNRARQAAELCSDDCCSKEYLQATARAHEVTNIAVVSHILTDRIQSQKQLNQWLTPDQAERVREAFESCYFQLLQLGNIQNQSKMTAALRELGSAILDNTASSCYTD